MAVETDISFPDPSMENWRQAAEKALKGEDFDATLRTSTADGLTIDPLYDRAGDSSPLARTAPSTPWTIVQKMDHTDPSEANAQALADLMNGATGLAMVFADAHSARGYGMIAEAETFDAALDEIDLNAIALHIEPGPRGK